MRESLATVFFRRRSLHARSFADLWTTLSIFVRANVGVGWTVWCSDLDRMRFTLSRSVCLMKKAFAVMVLGQINEDLIQLVELHQSRDCTQLNLSLTNIPQLDWKCCWKELHSTGHALDLCLKKVESLTMDGLPAYQPRASHMFSIYPKLNQSKFT